MLEESQRAKEAEVAAGALVQAKRRVSVRKKAEATIRFEEDKLLKAMTPQQHEAHLAVKEAERLAKIAEEEARVREEERKAQEERDRIQRKADEARAEAEKTSKDLLLEIVAKVEQAHAPAPAPAEAAALAPVVVATGESSSSSADAAAQASPTSPGAAPAFHASHDEEPAVDGVPAAAAAAAPVTATFAADPTSAATATADAAAAIDANAEHLQHKPSLTISLDAPPMGQPTRAPAPAPAPAAAAAAPAPAPAPEPEKKKAAPKKKWLRCESAVEEQQDVTCHPPLPPCALPSLFYSRSPTPAAAKLCCAAASSNVLASSRRRRSALVHNTCTKLFFDHSLRQRAGQLHAKLGGCSAAKLCRPRLAIALKLGLGFCNSDISLFENFANDID